MIFTAILWIYSHLSLWDAAISLLCLFVSSCIFNRLTNKGPMQWPVLGTAPSLLIHFDDAYNFVTEALIKAGGTYPYRGIWLGRAYGIMTADSSNVEYTLKTNFKNFPKGKYYRERFQDLLGCGIFNADDEVWKGHRRRAKQEMHSTRFAEHSLKTMQNLVQHKLLDLTEKMAETGRSFDLQEVLLRFTFDNICIAALGVDPGCLALDLPQVPFAKAFEEATELTLFRFMTPPFVWKPMKFFNIGPEKRLKNAIAIVHQFADKTVKERRERFVRQGSLSDESDLLSRLVENEKLPDEYFRDFCVSFILAGRDTTSVALTWFFWLVQNHPDVEKKILTEIKDILSYSDSSKEEKNTVFTFEELNCMVYLQAALSESLRLYPSVPMEIKEVMENDVLPDGSVVKKGARIIYCIYAMGRMESLWGKDCSEFKPERWIKDKKFSGENQFKYVVFNAGPRLCLGKKFAYMQMKMVAAAILLRYSVKVVEGHNVVPKVTTTLYMKDGLLVTLKPRLSASA